MQKSMTPPLSPILVAGALMPPFAPPLLQPIVDATLRFVVRNHPAVMERLQADGAPSFLIEPIDLPLTFFLETGTPKIVVSRPGQAMVENGDVDATIKGPLLALIDMLEGRVDGDSLFFSRNLEISGNTEAVLLLRNAVDNAEIDLMGDLLKALGPLAAPARYAFSRSGELHDYLTTKLDFLHRSAIAPLARRIDAQARRLEQFETRIDEMEKGLRRQQRRTT